MYKIKFEDEFDSAHFLEDTETACDGLHGHRWKVVVILKSEGLSDKGWIINFSTAKKWLKEITEKFDHNLLNYYIEQPTAENLSYCIFRLFNKKLWKYNKTKNLHVEIDEVQIAETPKNTATFGCYDINVKSESARRAAFKMWDSEDTRENIIKGLKKANQKEELRFQRSQRMIENNPMKSRVTVEKMLKSLKKHQHNCPNKEEQQVIQFMTDNDLPFVFVGDGTVSIGGKIPDFINEDKKIIVEYNGRFWHSDNNPWYDVKNDEEERRAFFNERGYLMYVIWSDEFKIDKERILKELKGLKNEL